MALMTGEEYKESLRALDIELYFMGERIRNRVDHPIFRPHINAAAAIYDLAHNPKHGDLGWATSHLTGERVNRFTHIHHSPEDLVKKVKAMRVLGQETATCFQRCPGWDAMNALYGVTYEMDKALGGSYHQRFLSFLKEVQKRDLMPTGSMTDPKGDRSLPPSKQADPDLYLRIVERRKDGIVVRGAKLHQTGGINAHEVLTMPTRALGPEDAAYAVAFAVPANTKGLIFVFGRQTNDTRRLEDGEIDLGNSQYGIVGGEATIIFDNVFVPWERVFMAGEHQFAGLLVERFASYHRQNYGGCKTGVSDVVIGASAALAEIHGLGAAPHIRDKLTEMVHLTETLYSCALACSWEGKPTPSGAYFVDPVLANVTKQNITRYIYEIYRLAQDIAGGLVGTMPAEKDFQHPVVGKLLEKYYRAGADTPTLHRVRLVRFIENMTCSVATVESMHGAGSPMTQRVVLLRQANLEEKKKLAFKIAGIEEQ